MHHNERELRNDWRELRSEYPELQEWDLKVSGRIRRNYGNCHYNDRVLKVARWVVEADLDQAIETLRHEAAHAMSFHDMDLNEYRDSGTHWRKHLEDTYLGHGDNWKEWAVRLGAVPEATCKDHELWEKHAPVAKKKKRGLKWQLECPDCGKVFFKAKRLTQKKKRMVRGKGHDNPGCTSELRWVQLR